MFRFKLTAGALLAILVLASQSALAQFPRLPRGLNFPSNLQNVFMLSQPEVQKELALTAEQNSKIETFGGEMMTELMGIFTGMQDLTPEEAEKEAPTISKMLSDKAKEIQAKVDKVLDEKQVKRAWQLSLQQRGVAALEDEEIAKDLKISAEQLAKLKDVREAATEKQMDLVQEMFTGGDPNVLREKLTALQADQTTQALAVLSEEQRSEFEKLKGPKFDFPPARGLF